MPRPRTLEAKAEGTTFEVRPQKKPSSKHTSIHLDRIIVIVVQDRFYGSVRSQCS